MKRLLILFLLFLSSISYAVVYSTQPFVGQDTTLIYDAPDNNYGGTTFMRVRKASDTTNSYRVSVGLAKYDLTPIAGQTILGATYYMYLSGAGWTERHRFVCNRILVANDGWVAGVNDGVAQDYASAWAYKTRAFGGGALTKWAGHVQSSGCSISNTDWSNVTLGTYVLGNQNLPDGWQMVVPLNVTEFNNMVSANYGMFLHIVAPNAAGGANTDFYSANSATAGYRPKLEIEYSAPAAAGSRRKQPQVICVE